MSTGSIVWAGWYVPGAFLLAGVYLLMFRARGPARQGSQGSPAVAVGVGWLYVTIGAAGLVAIWVLR